MKRILKFNSDKAEEDLNKILEEIERVQHHLDNLTTYAINYYLNIKKKYGQGRERKTEIRNFDTIDTTKVAVANEKLYANLKEGFVGYGIKKEEYICECSDIDDVIVFRKDGKYMVSKVTDKAFFGKDILHVDVFKRNDKRTIYNVVYRHGRTSKSYIKRFNVTSVTRDKEYDLTKGEEGSRILYFTANPNGEAEIVKIFLKPKPKLRKLIIEQDFADVAIKGRNAQGNILTKNDIHKLSLKEEGVSTLGGRKIWFDNEVLRINADDRGTFLGEFSGDDKILVITKDGVCRLTNFDLSNHYEENIRIIEKYDPDKVFTAIHYDSEQEFFYLKRFNVEEATKEQIFIGETEGSYLVEISDDEFPQLKLIFGGKHDDQEDEVIDAEEFIAIKGLKARGKRITTFETKEIIFIEPLEKETENSDDDDQDDDDDNQEIDNEPEMSENEIELEIIEPQDEDTDVVEKETTKVKDKPKVTKTKEPNIEEKLTTEKNKKDKGKKPPPDDTQMSLGF